MRPPKPPKSLEALKAPESPKEDIEAIEEPSIRCNNTGSELLTKLSDMLLRAYGVEAKPFVDKLYEVSKLFSEE